MTGYPVPLDPDGGDVTDMDAIELWTDFFAIGAALLGGDLDHVDRSVLVRRIGLILREVKRRGPGDGDGRGTTTRPPTNADGEGRRACPHAATQIYHRT
jgi:hypothetical protein